MHSSKSILARGMVLVSSETGIMEMQNLEDPASPFHLATVGDVPANGIASCERLVDTLIVL